MREPRVLSLFDVQEDVSTSSMRVQDMTVGPATTEDVHEFCSRYHYSNTGGSMMWRFGLWHGVVLMGVVAYNLPTRDVCESVFGPEHFDKVWHMGRLAMADDAPRNSESRLIGGSLRSISKRDVWAVVTYAATDAGHLGYVYQATNALYTGSGGDSTYFVDQSGQRRSTYLTGNHVSAERAASMGWEKHSGGPKHRYIYVLGNKTQRRQRMKLLRYPVLPYPKEVVA